MMRMHGTSGMRTGFMMGCLIGVFAGMYLTSRASHKIKHFANNIKEDATETWEHIEERMHSTMDHTTNQPIEQMSQVKNDMEIGELGRTSHKIQTKANTGNNKSNTDALVQAFLATEEMKNLKKK